MIASSPATLCFCWGRHEREGAATSIVETPDRLDYTVVMSKFEDIKTAVRQLTESEQVALRAWLEELEEQRFDEQIERDEKAGKLDRLAARGLENLKAGRVRDL
jgi:hypothetical protein